MYAQYLHESHESLGLAGRNSAPTLPGPDQNRNGDATMAKRQLPSPELLRQLLAYDPETGRLRWRERSDDFFSTGYRNARAWNALHAGSPALDKVDQYGYRGGMVLGVRVSAHRAIWAIVTNRWPAHQIDHVNGDRADNRFANLRDVTNEMNARNKKRHRFNSSGHNGVSWDKGCQKWRVHIGLGGKIKYIGVYPRIEDAVAARAAAECGHGFTGRHGAVV